MKQLKTIQKTNKTKEPEIKPKLIIHREPLMIKEGPGIGCLIVLIPLIILLLCL